MANRTINSWNQSIFDSTYSPSIPKLSVEIAGPNVSGWYAVENAIIDTGADWTIVPEKILSQIDANEWDEARLRSQWGEFRHAYRYEVDIRIADRTFPRMLVVGDELGDEVILGRNFLNWLRILFDGPNQVVDLIE